MKTKNFFCLRGIFVISLIGITLTVSAQIGSSQQLSNLDSVAFHQWWIDYGNSTTGSSVNTNANNYTTSVSPYKGQFTLGGNVNTFYPVSFMDDGGWHNNEATILNIGRSNTHENAQWHGSLIASFRFHVSYWGHGSEFIDADIRTKRDGSDVRRFVGGWEDASRGNLTRIIIWLKGGTTYYWHCNYSQTPLFPNYSTGQIVVNGTTYSAKTQPDSYVNTYGATLANDLWVRGSIRAKEVRVQVNVGADFVFDDDYNLLPLEEVEQFINENKHLPDIAPANEMIQNGMDVSEMQIKLLQKIEELTLYIIEQNKELQQLKAKIEYIENKSSAN